MTTFAEAVSNDSNRVFTENGAAALATTNSAVVDFFYQVGASRGKNVLPQFLAALAQNEDLAVRTLLWSRDIRGGAGERQIFRDLLAWLETNRFDVFERVIRLVPEIGRYDDLLVAKTPRGFDLVASMLRQAITDEVAKFGSSTASKWLPRQATKGDDNAARLRKAWGMSPKQYRKFLVNSTKVVENQMCARQWDQIDYEKVPSLAMARYTKAFNRRDENRFSAYKDSLVSGTAKINASAVYPYDVLKVVYTDPVLANEQWKNLPNYLGDNFILPMVDVSGSMTQPVGGNKNLDVMTVAISLGLYVAMKQQGPFANMSLTFSAKPEIQKYNANAGLKTNYEKIRQAEWGMNTDLQAAFEKILEVAQRNKVAPDQMPKYLMILSDMEFDAACFSGGYWNRNVVPKDTLFETCQKLYAAFGYELPKIVFWNLASRNNHTPVTFDQYGTALISGFSPSVMKAVLACDTARFNPLQIVLDTIMVDRYRW